MGLASPQKLLYTTFMHIWDYNVKDNWEPRTNSQWEWFLVRKINYGDIIGLKKEMIKKYFPKIKKLLDPGKREMFANFLNIWT